MKNTRHAKFECKFGMRWIGSAHNFVLEAICIAIDDCICECIDSIVICIYESDHGAVNGNWKLDDGVVLR